MRYISETVQLVKFAGSSEDAHGNAVAGWGAPTNLGIYAFNPSTSSEVLVDGHMHRVESSPTIYVPVGSGVAPRDRIVARGITYVVDGVEAAFRNPYDSSMDGDSIQLMVVTG